MEASAAADLFFGKQWGLDDTGQEYDRRTGTDDADIERTRAENLP
jgi:hypothetical protein